MPAATRSYHLPCSLPVISRTLVEARRAVARTRHNLCTRRAARVSTHSNCGFDSRRLHRLHRLHQLHRRHIATSCAVLINTHLPSSCLPLHPSPIFRLIYLTSTAPDSSRRSQRKRIADAQRRSCSLQGATHRDTKGAAHRDTEGAAHRVVTRDAGGAAQSDERLTPKQGRNHSQCSRPGCETRALNLTQHTWLHGLWLA